jgi:hypothetical protein
LIQCGAAVKDEVVAIPPLERKRAGADSRKFCVRFL